MLMFSDRKSKPVYSELDEEISTLDTGDEPAGYGDLSDLDQESTISG